jgi:hypothetical protein
VLRDLIHEGVPLCYTSYSSTEATDDLKILMAMNRENDLNVVEGPHDNPYGSAVSQVDVFRLGPGSFHELNSQITLIKGVREDVIEMVELD